MNIMYQFTEYLNTLGIATRGVDLFYNAPASNESKSNVWWVVPAGGTNEVSNFDVNRRVQFIDIFYRGGRNTNDVYEVLEAARTAIQTNPCLGLDGYETIRVDVVSELTDSGTDSELRRLGALGVRVEILEKVI